MNFKDHHPKIITMLNLIARLSRIMAYLGGAMLVMLIVMTCISILGRSLNSILHSDLLQSVMPGLANALLDLGIGPVNGDYELLQAGMAFSIFAFLPICQLTAGHASVDVFTSMMPQKVSRFMVWLSELAFALVLVLIAWQLTNGLSDKYRGGETTFLLQFPVWWSYALSMTGAYMAALVAAVMFYYRSLEFLLGKKVIFPQEGEGQ